MLRNRSMPEDVLVPVLAYPDVAAACEHLCAAFGFTQRWRIGTHRAQLGVGETAALAVRQGDGPDGAADHVMVRVADVDAHCATARSHGAEIVAEPADMPYGERQYTARDLFGRTWVFSQSVADVAPESWGATTANSRRADLRGGAATSVD